MATKLERLLEKIDPKNTIDKIERSLNHAVSTYRRDKNTVDSWDECKPCLVKMFQHLHSNLFKFPKELEFDQALYQLEKEYGNYQTVFEIMQSGAEGGVNTILRTLARLMAEQYSRHQIELYVTDYWNSLSVDEKMAASDEYLKIYKDILPGDSLDYIRLQPFFDQALQEHPFILKKIRDQKRSY